MYVYELAGVAITGVLRELVLYNCIINDERDLAKVVFIIFGQVAEFAVGLPFILVEGPTSGQLNELSLYRPGQSPLMHWSAQFIRDTLIVC